MLRLPSCVLIALLASPASLGAQAHPATRLAPWIEFGFGRGRLDPDCAGCAQTSSMNQATGSVTLGLTITPRLGVAVLGREFSGWATMLDGHIARYVVVLGQYSPVPGLTMNVGTGIGEQLGDPPPNGDNGRGSVVAAGLALRLPPARTFGLTLTADLIKTVSGSVKTVAGGVGSSYRPLLLSVGLGVNIAASGEDGR